ncbi:MAG: hypothetical protein UW24_C0018G0035 [Parcubacteria group bacterium GW2011_GWA2_44_12]|nr:MAG: hypothetical protein UW24_C0018G0035 [Parcubacteria group bacterium GW2011_GWA2_44_12]
MREPLESVPFSFVMRKSARARRMRITVYNSGRVVLTLPKSMKETKGVLFLREKKRWILKKLASVIKTRNNTSPHAPPLPFKSGDFHQHQHKAREVIQERVAYFNEIYRASYRRITIRNQKTRWGSCSKNGNLNFNYKILFLPSALRDYIIVHELCHLLHFNHSKNFWSAVESAVPNHRALRKELKKYELREE